MSELRRVGWPRRRPAVALSALLSIGATGCGSGRCTPVSVVVAQKEERARVANVSGGLYRTGPTGRLDPVETPGVVREYWVRSAAGEWYRVGAEAFKSADVGQPIAVCR